MTRIADLQSISTPALNSVFVVSDGTLTKKITLADLKTNIVSQATANALGTVKIGAGLEISDTGVVSVKNYSAYTLPVASASTLGGVRVGSGLKISDTSVLSLDYTLPTASVGVKGGVKVGDGLSITGEVLSVVFPDFSVFNNNGLTIGNSNNLKLFVNSGNIPTIKEQINGLINFSILDANKSGGFSDFRFVSSSIATALGGNNSPALIPDVDGATADIGLPSYRWDNMYANTVYGNLEGNVIGDIVGTHTGNIMAADNTVAYNATLKRFTGNVVGNITGNAGSADQLSIQRKINGIVFDGTQDIVISDSTKLPLSGAAMGGFITLHADPTNALHAATKNYVDIKAANSISTAGGTMIGALTLSGLPTNPFHAASKVYVDNKASQYVLLAGSTMTGFLTLHSDPVLDKHSATKGYTDTLVDEATSDLTSALTSYINQADATKLPYAGGTLTGFLSLHANPTSAAHASTKQYVDTSIDNVASNSNSVLRQYIDQADATKLPYAGGTLTGPLTLSADPTQILHAATKGYVDVKTSNLTSSLSSYIDVQDATKLSLSGGTMTGYVNLHADPSSNAHAANKHYVDSSISAVASSTDSVLRQYIDTRDNTRLPLAGGTMIGALTLNADPTAALHAATKQYVDAKSNGSSATLTNYTDQAVSTKLPYAGGIMTGHLTLNADPVADLHASTKRYVDTRINAVDLTVTTGSTVLSSAYYQNAYFDVYPPAGKTMADLEGFIPSYGSTQSGNYYYYWWWGGYYDNNALTWDRYGDRIRVNISNNYYYYYYYYYYGTRIHWLAIWR